MSTYTFTFKKDDIFVEFNTTDKEIVEKQFQIWVADADAYARGHNKEKRGKEDKSRESQTSMQSEIRTFEPNLPESSSTKIEATIKESIPSIEPPQPEILDQASTLLKTINTIQDEDAKNEENKEQKTEIKANFDDALEKSIENPTFEPTKTQDKLFLNLVNSKNTNDKFHYLIITAYYLSEFEKQERFSLKQINSKLMQNLSEVIDHVTLQ